MEHLKLLPTPAPVTAALMESQDIRGTVMECCAGKNAITEVLIEHGLSVTATDIQWSKSREKFTRDATRHAFWQHYGHFDWIVTNPPFTLATEILELAWEYCNVGCAFLLRITYAEPVKSRADLLRSLADHQVLHMPVNPRPKFRDDKKGTDPATVAWMAWRKDFSYKALGIPSPFQYLTNWRID